MVERDWVKYANGEDLSYTLLKNRRGKEYLRHFVSCLVFNVDCFGDGTNILHSEILNDWFLTSLLLILAPNELKKPSQYRGTSVYPSIVQLSSGGIHPLVLKEIIRNVFDAFDIKLLQSFNRDDTIKQLDIKDMEEAYRIISPDTEDEFWSAAVHLTSLRNLFRLFQSPKQGNIGLIAIDREATDWKNIFQEANPSLLRLLPEDYFGSKEEKEKAVERLVLSASTAREKRVLKNSFEGLWNISVSISENREEEARLLSAAIFNNPGLYAPPNVSPEWVRESIIRSGVENTLKEVKELNKKYLLFLVPSGKTIINETLPYSLDAFEETSPSILHLIPSSNGHYYLLSSFDIQSGYNPYTKVNVNVDLRPLKHKSYLLSDLWSEVICRSLS